MINNEMVSTTFELPGYRIEAGLGMVQGIVVRSRSVFGSIGAGFQTIFGGDITLYTRLCENTRRDAFSRMLAQAEQIGGNAVIGVRYDSTELGRGITEVLCYGTVVRVLPAG